jgi:hypothetical protein
MESQPNPAPPHEQQAALDALQQEIRSPEDQAVMDQWQAEIHAMDPAQDQPEAEPTQAEAQMVDGLVAPSQESQDGTDEEVYQPKHLAKDEDPVDSLPEGVKSEILVDNRDATPKHLKREDNPAEAPDLLEETGKPISKELRMLDNNLRRMVSIYRKERAAGLGFTEEDFNERAGAINDAFEQLADKAGWDEATTASKQGMLFSEMAKRPQAKKDAMLAAIPDELLDRIDAEAAEGKVEDITNGRTVDETFDDIINAAKPEKSEESEAEPQTAVSPEAIETVLSAEKTADETWNDLEQQEGKWFNKVRGYAQRLIERIKDPAQRKELRPRFREALQTAVVMVRSQVELTRLPAEADTQEPEKPVRVAAKQKQGGVTIKAQTAAELMEEERRRKEAEQETAA